MQRNASLKLVAVATLTLTGMVAGAEFARYTVIAGILNPPTHQELQEAADAKRELRDVTARLDAVNAKLNRVLELTATALGSPPAEKLPLTPLAIQHNLSPVAVQHAKLPSKFLVSGTSGQPHFRTYLSQLDDKDRTIDVCNTLVGSLRWTVQQSIGTWFSPNYNPTHHILYETRLGNFLTLAEIYGCDIRPVAETMLTRFYVDGE